MVHNNQGNEFFIIGAGISGLILGYELASKGHKVTIYEKTNRVGGLATSFEKYGFSIDTGPHLFHSAHPEIIDYWRGFVGELLVEKHFYSGNFVAGKFYDYPINKETMFEQYSKAEVSTIERELGAFDEDKIAASLNYNDYVRSLCGPYLAKMFFTKYPAKLWGLETSELSARFAPRRIEIREERRPFHSGGGKFAGIIEGGCGVLADKLKNEFLSLGGIIEFQRNVKRLDDRGDNGSPSIAKVIFNDDTCVDCSDSTVISTAPMSTNATFLGNETSLYFRSCHSLVFVTRGDDPFPSEYDWLYFGEDETPFHRVGMQTRFSRKGVPDNVHIMCCEIAYTEKPSDAKKLIWEEISRKRLVEIGLLEENEIIHVIHDDLGPVYPGYFVGHEQEVARVSSVLNKYDNLYSLGSLAEYAYSDLQVLTAKAIDLAGELDNGTHNIKTSMIKDKSIVIPSGKFNFGKSVVSNSMQDPVFLIAEIGLCHNGSVQLCKELIQVAKDAGFDAVKIQTYSEGRISAKTRTARYFEETLDVEESISSFLDRIIFKKQALQDIFDFSKSINIELFSTPFDFKSVDLLEELGVSGYKISSMDLVNLPLISKVASIGKPVILSTGMASMGEIEAAIGTCLKAGCADIAVLHCVSSYPCPLSIANFPRIKRIAEAFGVVVGFSDHTLEVYSPSLACVAGARVIEKHITMNKGMDGPDHNFSLNPAEMIEMVSSLRQVESSMSPHQMESSSGELSAKQNLKRSIYASVDLKIGDIVTKDSICIKSPGDGIPVPYYDLILNKKLISSVSADYPLKWSDFLAE